MSLQEFSDMNPHLGISSSEAKKKLSKTNPAHNFARLSHMTALNSPAYHPVFCHSSTGFGLMFVFPTRRLEYSTFNGSVVSVEGFSSCITLL